jgi:hypothetical protein
VADIPAERQPEHACLPNCPAHLPPWDRAAKVSDCACRGGHRNAMAPSHAVIRQGPAPVQPDSGALRPPCLAWHGNAHSFVPDVQERPKGCGAPMTDNRPLTASEDGRHPPSVKGDSRMTDRIDAPMDPVQPATGKATRDRACAETRRQELGRRDNAVLSFRDLRHLGVCPVDFLPHVGRKSTAAMSLPPVTRSLTTPASDNWTWVVK